MTDLTTKTATSTEPNYITTAFAGNGSAGNSSLGAAYYFYKVSTSYGNSNNIVFFVYPLLKNVLIVWLVLVEIDFEIGSFLNI